MDVLDLTDFFTTKAEATDFSARLSQISSELYENEINLEESLQKRLGVIKKDNFMSLLRENNIPLDSNSAINKFIEQINENISGLTEATITIAIEPDKEMLISISDWFLRSIKKQVLIEIVVDQSLIGGAIIHYKGKRIDASLKKIFIDQKPIETNNQQANEEIKHSNGEAKESPLKTQFKVI